MISKTRGILKLNKIFIAALWLLSSASAFGLTNAPEALESDFPATAKLYVLDTHMCTGTFLNDTTVLTARHCIDLANATGNVRVDSNGQQVLSLNVFYVEAEDPSLPAQLNYQTDLAIVVFPVGTGTGRGIAGYPVFANEAPFPSDWAFLLGYGGTDLRGTDAGTLRSGQHQIMFVDDTSFSWVALADEQNVAPGDSGSAGYIDGKIAGVATLAGDVFNLGIARIGAFRSLFDDKAKDLFERAIHCDKGPCAAEFRPL